jgi:hypothetical protein
MVMINGGHEKKPRGIISVTQVTNRPCGVEGHHVYHKHGISARL